MGSGAQARTHEAAPIAVSPSALKSKAFTALNAGLAASTCQPDLEGVRVGLLPGLRPEYMQSMRGWRRSAGHPTRISPR